MKNLINTSNLDSLSTHYHEEDFDSDLILKHTVKKIAFKIFFELKKQNLNQQDLANLLQITPQSISKMLKGDDYKVSTLVKIEEVLKINLINREIYSQKESLSVYIRIDDYVQIKQINLTIKDQSGMNELLNSFSPKNALSKKMKFNKIKLEDKFYEI
ncbi:helix-turn-helix transcriptional regulator [Myroides odoratimimus]|uniref:helix-turn-helix domain-containing protein n=1 Tax=Myroides odoratimimus TaxID=76832 RepID=UPI002574956B|nr:helix-turn-helix transcriptional regulator [Myroides odoratimimus]MDM1456750.1 helix-turn-helix transcriptional regulator [Myroides odoratimimus]MDM1518114.1 helix-turn-helix transcriptional regulator [Myroides odoratimimus]